MTTFIKKNSFSILFIVFAWGLAFLYIQLTTESESLDHFQSITISSGDTLWEIAADYQDQSNHSISEFVSWVEKNNDIKGTDIKPGDVIVIPVEFQSEPQYFASSGE